MRADFAEGSWPGTVPAGYILYRGVFFCPVLLPLYTAVLFFVGARRGQTEITGAAERAKFVCGRARNNQVLIVLADIEQVRPNETCMYERKCKSYSVHETCMYVCMYVCMCACSSSCSSFLLVFRLVDREQPSTNDVCAEAAHLALPSRRPVASQTYCHTPTRARSPSREMNHDALFVRRRSS